MSSPDIPINAIARAAEHNADTLSQVAESVLRSGHYVLGPHVERFEREFADYVGVANCVGVANGTDALELALRALGVARGDRVAVAANAAMYGTGAVLAVGAEPLFVDVDPTTSLMTPQTLSAALERDSATAARAVIVTHLYGQLADMTGLLARAAQSGIRVIEDCAQAHGARDEHGAMAGSFGDASTFSYYPTKNLGAVGDGGAVATNNASIADRLRQLRQYGWVGKYRNVLAGGKNSRLDELQAAFLSALLPGLDDRNDRRRAIANRYGSGICNPSIETPAAMGGGHVAHLYVVRTQQRDSLAAHLASRGIGCDVHYPVPDHRQAVHQGRYADVSLPACERLCNEVLTLPCFPELRDDEVDAVIDACNQWAAA